MSLLTRAGDLVYTFRFIKLLITGWQDTSAFKLGIIDEKGKRVKTKKIESSEEKSSYTTFHRLVFNIKRLIQKAPGGGSKLASYASALFLIKEHFGIEEKHMEKILRESGLDFTDLLQEQHAWYLLEDNQLSPGIYKILNDKLLSDSLQELAFAKDKIRIGEDCFPIDEIFGINIYEADHVGTNQKIHFTIGEIYK
jgi:hypothetical protein|tara:strand:+ start:1827 stop:2414 length:588 start_codon:yes stop_codon:yes gene_type:complete